VAAVDAALVQMVRDVAQRQQETGPRDRRHADDPVDRLEALEGTGLHHREPPVSTLPQHKPGFRDSV
jgi:hypothetical protein